jgi:hypothetical protein
MKYLATFFFGAIIGACISNSAIVAIAGGITMILIVNVIERIGNKVNK